MTQHILIVDDHPLMRLALRAQIESETGWAVAGEAANGREAIELALALQPDIVLMDLLMPEMDGLAAIQAIVSACPQARILVLTSSAENRHLAAAIRAGALGYILKETPPEELLHAIHEIGQGHPVIPPALMRQVLDAQTGPARVVPKDVLSAREQEVLACLGKGATNREIADQLALSEGTVRTHVRNILGKLHFANRTQAALFAAQTKTPPED